MTIRYMGTKRHMVDSVSSAIQQFAGSGRAVDLFSGMGSVAESLSDGGPSVITNDALEFTACLSRARFTGKRRADTVSKAAGRLKPAFDVACQAIASDYESSLVAEIGALNGSIDDLAVYVNRSAHVANSTAARKAARRASEAAGLGHYRLASLYFGAGYLSLQQAVEVDALRYAIDLDDQPVSRDWLLAAWLTAVSAVLNSPGHTAQFLRPNSESAHRRMARTWRRRIWDEFETALQRTQQIGSSAWRQGNDVLVTDALDLLSRGALANVDVIYADPPYTKDQYSRFYHLYETLYRYDYPDSHGTGRVRSDRFSTGFSLKSSVRASFHDLCRNVARVELPLIVSYPTGGLLELAGVTFPDVASQYFADVSTTAINVSHSTMGASSGASKKTATENLYVCTGRRSRS